MKNRKNDLDDFEAGSQNQDKKNHDKKFKRWGLLALILISIGLITFISVAIATKRTDLIKTVFYDVLLNNVLAVPSLLIGIIVFFGYLLQKKPWYDALSGGIKGIVGYLILQMGAAFLTGISKPLMTIFGSIIGSKVVLLDTYTGWSEINAQLGSAVSVISYAVLVGMAFNILLVAFKRFTNVHSINVTGHIMFQQTSCLIAFTHFVLFKDMNSDLRQTLDIAVAGILIGTYWGVFSNLALAPTNKITNNANFSIGHQQMFGVWCAAQAGRLFNLKNNEIKSAETLKMKKSFRIFHDNIFTSSILMFIFFGILFVIIRASDVAKWDEMIKQIGGYNLFSGKSWFIQMVGLIFSVVASIQILMIGARMFVAELQRSFLGISNKLIPGAVVAIDIAGVFSYGEKSVTYGFMAGAIGNFVGIGVVILLGNVLHISAFSVVIMVGFIPMFFDNAALGLYANSTGGWKACIVVPFVAGILVVFGTVFLVKTAGHVGNIYTYSYNGLFDWTTMWAVLMGIISLIPNAAAIYMPIFVLLIFMVVALLTTTEPGKNTAFKNLLIKKFIKNKNKKELNV